MNLAGRILDISPLVSPKTAVFPGDVPYTREVALDFAHGHNLLLSSVKTTVHIGAHCDAPNHYHPGGAAIDARPLHYYLGECEVMRVALARGERILPEHLGGRVPRAPRVLFHTGSFPDPEAWNGDFVSLSAPLVEWLAERGVVLVGIDTPSVDLADDKVLLAHQAIFARDMAVLEGIVLDHVPEGLYTLVALPLKLDGADASPVRAVLVDDVAPSRGGEAAA